MRISFRTLALGLIAMAALALAVLFASPTASAAGAGCGGKKIPKRGGGHWRCTFADDFDGGGLDAAKWLPQLTQDSGYTNGQSSCFSNSPNNVWVSRGSLKLTARPEASPFTCWDPNGPFTTSYTSGGVSTWGRFGQAYGRFEIRAKVPSARTQGLQSAIWLSPADPLRYGGWPTHGEIDIAEMFSCHPGRAFAYVHYTPAAVDPAVTNRSCKVRKLRAFHTYALEWTRKRIRVMYDGKTCLATHWTPAAPLYSPQPFDQPFVIALTQALGVGANAFDPATTPLPATTTIDYVRVWK